MRTNASLKTMDNRKGTIMSNVDFLLEKVREKSLSQKVVIFGGGLYGMIFAEFLGVNHIPIAFYCDNNEEKWGKVMWGNFVCRAPGTLGREHLCLIVVKHKNVSEKIEEQLKGLNVDYMNICGDIMYEIAQKLTDEQFVKVKWFWYMGKVLNIDEPKTYNEKLQWLKLYDRKTEYTDLVDKYKVKEIIANKIGGEHIIPTLGVWNGFEEIDFSKLPDKFVLKCTHDSGSVIICREKAKLDLDQIREKMQMALKYNYFWLNREWPYKNIKPRIMAEKYMVNEEESYLEDYKIFCFDGIAKVILTVWGGHDDENRAIRRMYDTSWKNLNVGIRKKAAVTTSEPRPAQLDKMLEIAENLAVGTKHVRVDLYVCGNQIYFGELTFFHMSGYEDFEPESFDLQMGNYLSLSKIKI